MARTTNRGFTIKQVQPAQVDGTGEDPNRPRVKVGCGSPNSGTIALPDGSSDPSVSKKKGNLSFTECIDTGYSPNRFGGVNVIEPNGSTASSRGQGRTINPEGEDGIDGFSNKIRGWPGGNRTAE